ncbi:MAG TPA: hypothetical protein VHC69_21250 [Polyangiaceae bacterium]|nr:hypothetical protein [Polyangiaceae bacterium]
MKTATIHSRCECQNGLGAELDEQRRVLRGWARERRSGRTLTAPAHSIPSETEVFEVAWSCPFCTRNQVRLFDTSALVYRDPGPQSATP